MSNQNSDSAASAPKNEAALPANPKLDVEKIARVTHETNRAYCATIGDDSQKPWDEAADWQKESALVGVQYALDHPGVSPAQMHESWFAQKVADGWKFGPEKDEKKKEHPCMVPYYKLPPEQQLKDALFRAVVFAFRDQSVETVA
jgi:hypothetical protein